MDYKSVVKLMERRPRFIVRVQYYEMSFEMSQATNCTIEDLFLQKIIMICRKKKMKRRRIECESSQELSAKQILWKY